MITRESYSLNLSPRYAPNWGAWEVAREIICNAIDADPSGMQIGTNGCDELIVSTTTVPNISELFIIGEGSKAPGGSTIGQFGEGLKMAALCAVRNEGGQIVLNLPGKSITFGFEKVMGADVLHAYIEPNPLHEAGYQAIVRMTGVALSHVGRILPGSKEGIMPKAGVDELRIYCKGVFVRAFSNMETIWDWNIFGLTINRDRSMVESIEVAKAAAKWLTKNYTDEITDELMAHPESWEAGQVIGYTYSSDLRQALVRAFRRVHGEKAVIASEEDRINQEAEEHGFVPIKVSTHMEYELAHGGVKRASESVPKSNDLEAIDDTEYRGRISQLRELDSIICAPGASVRVYANRNEALRGMAVFDDNQIWLSEGLFSPGNELELVRTYLHEMGHLMSGAGDSTTKFEHALDGIAGRLAMVLLEEKVSA